MPDEIKTAFSQAELDLLANAAKNPKTRSALERVLKEANPDARLPSVEIDERISQVESAIGKKVDELGASVSKLTSTWDEASQIYQLRQSRKLDDATFAEVKKFKEEKAIPDWNVAADAVLYQKQIASPTPAIPRKPQMKSPVADFPKEAEQIFDSRNVGRQRSYVRGVASTLMDEAIARVNNQRAG